MKPDLKEALQDELEFRFNVKAPIDIDQPLFSSGLIDSLSVIELVSFIERQAGVTIPPIDIVLDNFDSISAILAYLETVDE